jgi:hypothetical protein
MSQRVFCDRAVRDETIRRGLLTPVQAKKLRALCARLTLETCALWAWFHARGFEPVSTQDPVAYGRLGTCVDVVVRNTRDANQLTVLELKVSSVACVCSVAPGQWTRPLPPHTKGNMSRSYRRDVIKAH